MFQSLRAGSPIYLFDKNKLTAEVGEVVRIENEVDQFGNKVFLTGLMQPKVSFVDLVASFAGKEVKFNHVYADATITDSGTDGAILCENRQEFVDAIASYKKTSERILSEVENHRNIVERCEDILGEMDPRIRSEKAQSEEIAKLKSDMADIKAMLAQALKHDS